MIIEYPEYYERFRCIGGACPDTCCAGWEVDVDEASAMYYQGIKGAFGDRLRKSLKKEDGFSFPLNEKGRCPFLNNQNLCDIYTTLGEESLSDTCTEYPRYFMDIGEYEQADISLSCMELARIFFETPLPYKYIRSENGVPFETMNAEEESTLAEVLSLRNQAIAIMSREDNAFFECFAEVRRIFAEAGGFSEEEFSGQNEADLSEPVCENTEQRQNKTAQAGMTAVSSRFKQSLQLLQSLDSISPSWDNFLKAMEEVLREPALDQREQLFRTENREKLAEWFRKISVYFIYRYTIDFMLDGDLLMEWRLIDRSLRLIYTLLFLYCVKEGKKTVETKDIIYISHLFSREVEHDDQNIVTLKS